jgi:hypothetical protein
MADVELSDDNVTHRVENWATAVGRMISRKNCQCTYIIESVWPEMDIYVLFR